MTERDRIIAGLSDSELLVWHGQAGFAGLPRRQADRLAWLLAEARRELGASPRRMSPWEWAEVQVPAAEATGGALDEERVA